MSEAILRTLNMAAATAGLGVTQLEHAVRERRGGGKRG